MTRDDFRGSLTASQPPSELTPALAGLWWDARGDWQRPGIKQEHRLT